MNARRERFWFVLAGLSFAAAVSSILLMLKDRALLESARQEAAEWKAQVEARDKTIAELQASGQLQSSEHISGTVSFPSSSDALAELMRRVDQLTAQQAHTLTLVQGLASKGTQAESPGERQQRQQLAVASLDAELKTQQEKSDGAKQKVEQLATTLNVPDDVSKLDVSVGLDSVALKQYWPYFEAKRERDEMQRFVTLIKMKIIAEKMESR